MFEPLGELQLVFNNHYNYDNYYRELDIEKAIAKTSYKLGDVTYTREVLASLPDRLIVIRLRASKPHSISFTAFYLPALPKAEIKTTAARQLIISGTTIDHEGVKGMIRYEGITQIKSRGGSYSSTVRLRYKVQMRL
jgi:alpha-L-fucosidase 2